MTTQINLFDSISLLAFDSPYIPLVGPVKQPSFHNVNDCNIGNHPSHMLFIKDQSVCDRSFKHTDVTIILSLFNIGWHYMI